MIVIDLLPPPRAPFPGGHSNQRQRWRARFRWGKARRLLEDHVQLPLERTVMAPRQPFQSRQCHRLNIADMYRFHTSIIMLPLCFGKRVCDIMSAFLRPCADRAWNPADSLTAGPVAAAVLRRLALQHRETEIGDRFGEGYGQAAVAGFAGQRQRLRFRQGCQQCAGRLLSAPG